MGIEIKPFVKWAGGKGQLLKTLDSQLPRDFEQQESITYVEPFVGGGAMLFYMLTKYSNIKRAVICDVNKDLIQCYNLIKTSPYILIEKLRQLEQEYFSMSFDKDRRAYYLKKREIYNYEELSGNDRAAYFIFLNRTCFNGLYRENGDGLFNVPIGSYKRPTICNEDNIIEIHNCLKKVDIYTGDYSVIMRHLGRKYNFVYLDPPYRPLFGSSNFNEYVKGGFGDSEQEKLKKFCDKLIIRGCKIMLSNSYSTDENGNSYFDTLYKGYCIDRVLAPRFINAFAESREKEIELLIKNYDNVKMKLPIID